MRKAESWGTELIGAALETLVEVLSLLDMNDDHVLADFDLVSPHLNTSMDLPEIYRMAGVGATPENLGVVLLAHLTQWENGGRELVYIRDSLRPRPATETEFGLSNWPTHAPGRSRASTCSVSVRKTRSSTSTQPALPRATRRSPSWHGM